LVTRTWDEGLDTEKPRSVAIDRAYDIPPVRFIGFLLTQLDSLDIDIFKFQIKHTTCSALKLQHFITN
jgi:hypothetical protein